MAVRILELAGTVTVELIGNRPQLPGAGRRRLARDRIHVRYVKMDRDRGAADRLRPDGAHVGEFIGEHDHGVANLDFRMTDLAARRADAEFLLGAERLLVELDGVGRIGDTEIRRHTVIAGGNGSNPLWRRSALAGS